MIEGFCLLDLRVELDRGLMQRGIRCAQHNANLPVPTHRERPLRTVQPMPIWWQIYLVGSHIHVKHNGGKLNLHPGRRLSGRGILHLHRKEIEILPVRRHTALNHKLIICCLEGCSKGHPARWCCCAAPCSACGQQHHTTRAMTFSLRTHTINP